MTAATASCPACGETERLRGRQEPRGGITIACEACGQRWERGLRGCRTCGATDLVERPQAMTRTSRGTLRAVVGHRTVRLCRRCDAEALAASLEQQQAVPEEYVPRASGDLRVPVPPRPAPASPSPRSSEPPTDAPQLARPRPQPAPEPATHRVTDPTVRQAVADALESGVAADSAVVLLLGTYWGSSTRLSAVEGQRSAGDLAAWHASRWPDPSSDSALSASDGLRALVAHWRERGWLRRDLAAELPRRD